jgi:hypothetical protein
LLHLTEHIVSTIILWECLMNLQQKAVDWTPPELLDQLLQLLCGLHRHTGAVTITAAVTQPTSGKAESGWSAVEHTTCTRHMSASLMGRAHRARACIRLGDQIRLHLRG